jgi:hypothetical protein
MDHIFASNNEKNTITTNNLILYINRNLKAKIFEDLNAQENVTSKAFVCAILIILYPLGKCSNYFKEAA